MIFTVIRTLEVRETENSAYCALVANQGPA